MPPRAKRSASTASRSAGRPCGFRAEHVRARRVSADALAQAGDAVTRSTECRGQFGRERPHRAAPRRRAARCCRTACSATGRHRGRSLRRPGRCARRNGRRPRFDRLHLADDVAQHCRLVDRLQRHLDALLDRDRLGAGSIDGGVAAHVIGDGEAARSCARHHQRVHRNRAGRTEHHRVDVHRFQPVAERDGKVLQRQQQRR